MLPSGRVIFTLLIRGNFYHSAPPRLSRAARVVQLGVYRANRNFIPGRILTPRIVTLEIQLLRQLVGRGAVLNSIANPVDHVRQVSPLPPQRFGSPLPAVSGN